MQSLLELKSNIISCERCPRLRTYCQDIARKKKREFRHWDYWGKPVPGFGDPKARVWIVGLAPAAHGANRTGRMFTGDSSGNWLYRALYQTGFSNQQKSESRDDGLKLRDIFISSAARCAPPENKPSPSELANCCAFLDAEFRLLQRVKLFIALGAIGFNTTCRLLERNGVTIARPRPVFKHGGWVDLGNLHILASYHPSRQNTQTGRLTEAMWIKIFRQAREWLDRD